MKIKIFLWLLVSLLSFPSQASHLTGGYITYEYQAPNMYRFIVQLIHDCYGIPAPSSITLSVHSPTGNPPGSISLNRISSSLLQIGNCYPAGMVSSCSGGNGPGLKSDYYTSSWITMTPEAGRTFYYSSCCYSQGIMNIDNSIGSNLLLSITVDNLNHVPNSSPELTSGSLPVFCTHVASQFSFAATDSDGDSLSYELVPLYSGYTSSSGYSWVNYVPPYSYTNPFPSSQPILLDPVTGVLSFTATAIGPFQVGVMIKEYRNGVLIGSVYRSQLFIFSNGIFNPAFVRAKVFSDINSNQLQDPGEENIPFFRISFDTSGTVHTYFTDANGYVSIPVTPGTYVLKAEAPNMYFSSIPDSNTVVISNHGQIDSTSVFAIGSSGPPVSDLMVNVSGINPRPGFPVRYFIMAKNLGSATQAAEISLEYDTAFTVSGFSIPPDSMSPGYLQWNKPVFQFLTSSAYHALFELDTTAIAGTPYAFTARINPTAGDADSSDNVSVLNTIVVNSFDPNEKTVSPEGDLDIRFIQDTEWLNYTVYFQNTGTADAIHVRIQDVIDPKLDINSLEIMGASHLMSPELVNGNQMIFRFNNIMLPDSNSNEPLSHGFVSYRIKAHNTLVPGNQIQNTANIYFDFNPPIQTNTTVNTVTVLTLAPVVSKVDKIFIYPNPTSNFLNFTSQNDVEKLEVFDVTGRLKLSLPGSKDLSFLDVSDLNTGFYILRLTEKNKSTSMSFIKK